MLAAVRDLLRLPVPAPTMAASLAFHSEREVRAACVRSWCDSFLAFPALTPAEVAASVRGLAEERAQLPYATWAEWEYLQGMLAEQQHQIADPRTPPLAVAL